MGQQQGRTQDDEAARRRFVEARDGVFARTATSEVVCATDTRSGAPVLLKKCAKGGEGPARKRLECERRLLAKLDSPFIVRLLASFETREAVCLAFERVDGDDIARLLRRCGALPADAAREITADLVLALEHAHARGVVHRDIKASNVLLERSGRARLIDFNLAMELDSGAEARASSMCGTPHAMSPERLRGQCGFAADWWALGVLVFEMLRGKPPFWHDDRRELFRRIAEDAPPQLDALRDPRAADFVRALLAKDATARLGSRGGALEVKRHAWFEGVDWARRAAGDRDATAAAVIATATAARGGESDDEGEAIDKEVDRRVFDDF